LREARGDGTRLRQPCGHQNHGQAEIDTPTQKAHGHTGGAFAAGVAAKAKPLFKICTDLSRAAAWLAWVVRPVEGSTTGTPGSAGLLCKFLVYAYKDLKKLDVLKQGMAHWNGLSS
jgi:hypothetical protein